MSPLLKSLRPLIEPVVGLVFLLLWILAEIGRVHLVGFWIALALYAVAIGLSRLVPIAALAIVMAVPLAQLAGVLAAPESTTWPIWIAALAVAFGAGHAARPSTRWIGLASGVVSAGTMGVVLVTVGDWLSWTGAAGSPLGGLGFDYGAVRLQFAAMLAGLAFVGWLAAWTLGFALQLSARRREGQELLRRTELELAAADAERRSELERTAIAHEVHDVLAHSLAVVTAVADGTRYLREAKPDTPPARTDTALREIADTARSALVDLRGLLEGLRDEPGSEELRPRPALGDLSALVDRVSTTGMRVRLEHLGTPRPLTPSQELSVYRIVQESLTNALKHGGDHPSAAVSFSWEADGLVLTVVSTGSPRASKNAEGQTGPEAPDEGQARRFGIRSMKDRAHLAGGWLTAGLENDGDFVVTASIPTRDAEAGSGREEGAA